jgi:hypothetical protein
MAKGKVGKQTVRIEYADDVKFIGGIVVWGKGQGSVSFDEDKKTLEVVEGTYRCTFSKGTIFTPKGVQISNVT